MGRPLPIFPSSPIPQRRRTYLHHVANPQPNTHNASRSFTRRRSSGLVASLTRDRHGQLAAAASARRMAVADGSSSSALDSGASSSDEEYHWPTIPAARMPPHGGDSDDSSDNDAAVSDTDVVEIIFDLLDAGGGGENDGRPRAAGPNALELFRGLPSFVQRASRLREHIMPAILGDIVRNPNRRLFGDEFALEITRRREARAARRSTGAARTSEWNVSGGLPSYFVQVKDVLEELAEVFSQASESLREGAAAMTTAMPAAHLFLHESNGARHVDAFISTMERFLGMLYAAIAFAVGLFLCRASY
ncbi:hypothetical protein HDU87_006063 [Geranomyces variabilis]|uniref:Uncharacterized protein n=1 Tax=Geranomyces variabilis TaxID=109894 RepID=A0AAD5XKP6_9FUNG|nr:hypothetical protein HDU87_006063 [Geranomyces variabilis]